MENVDLQEESLSLDDYFMELARQGDIPQLKELLSEATLTYVNLNNTHALHYAAANAHAQVIRLLAQNIRKRHSEEQLKAIINWQNAQGNTPLHYSAFSKSKQTVQTLLDYGADPLLQNLMGRRAVQECELLGEYELCETIARSYKVSKQQLERLQEQMLGEIQQQACDQSIQ